MLKRIRGVKTLILKPWNKFKTLSLKKKILVIVLLFIIFVVLSQVISNASKPSTYKTVRATKGNIVEIVTETGTIAVNGRIDVYSPTNGVVEEVFVSNDDHVTTGQDLFTIKSSTTEQEKSQALANYLAAQNSLDTAKATLYSLQADMFSAWENYKELAESDEYENSDGTPRYEKRSTAEYHIAEKDWLAAENSYKKQQAVISQAQAAVSSTYLLYQATQNATVKATADGIISNLSVSRGSTIRANTPTAPARPLATIANLSKTEVEVSLSENDIAKVRDGQDVSLDINAIHEKKYKGIVSRVDTIGTNDQGVMRYNVYIEVINGDDRLRPGMSVDATITTKRLNNVLSVPNSAIKPYQGGRAVRVVENGNVKYIPVEIGVKGKDKTQIIKGIKDGQEVITSLSNEQIKRQGFF